MDRASPVLGTRVRGRDSWQAAGQEGKERNGLVSTATTAQKIIIHATGEYDRIGEGEWEEQRCSDVFQGLPQPLILIELPSLRSIIVWAWGPSCLSGSGFVNHRVQSELWWAQEKIPCPAPEALLSGACWCTVTLLLWVYCTVPTSNCTYGVYNKVGTYSTYSTYLYTYIVPRSYSLERCPLSSRCARHAYTSASERQRGCSPPPKSLCLYEFD